MLEIGINTNNQCGSDTKEILTNIKNAGFKNVMVAYKGGSIEEKLKMAQELGLNVPYVHLTNSNNFWAKGEANVSLMANLKQQIELTQKYHVPIAVLHATSGSADELALPPNEFGLNCILELVEFAKNHNVQLALENLDKPSFKHFKYVMKNIRDKNLGFCYDAGHHQLYVPKKDLLKKYGNRLLAVHLHDNLMDWKFGYDYTRDLHRLPLDGKINYNKIIKNLARAGYNNVIMLEVRKIGGGEPRLYKDMSDMDFLHMAKARAEKLAQMIEIEKSI